jgi:hypothetical protein
MSKRKVGVPVHLTLRVSNNLSEFLARNVLQLRFEPEAAKASLLSATKA